MDYALALGFGGMVVSVDDCDHTTYGNYGLICPDCRQTVFYVEDAPRVAHTRTVGSKCVAVKETRVKAHFAHHLCDVSPALECANRALTKTADMLSADRDFHTGVARGQLKGMFDAHLEAIINTKSELNDGLKDLGSWFTFDVPSSRKYIEANLSTLRDIATPFFSEPVQGHLSPRLDGILLMRVPLRAMPNAGDLPAIKSPINGAIACEAALYMKQHTPHILYALVTRSIAAVQNSYCRQFVSPTRNWDQAMAIVRTMNHDEVDGPMLSHYQYDRAAFAVFCDLLFSIDWELAFTWGINSGAPDFRPQLDLGANNAVIRTTPLVRF